ncbi:MAG: class I SAM-dependent methyltransferase [Armatimonadetes bacterium]|nr:class I SAM-dependent methyltransferase [Armatimonadota bacterium]
MITIRDVPTREGYDRWAPIYEKDGNPMTALETATLAPHLPDVGGLRVLDLGCGTGRHTLALAARGAFVTGLDFSAGMLGEARRKPGASEVAWIEHDLSQPLPFIDGEFDFVLSSLVLEHLPNLPLFFSEAVRVSRGPVLVTAMHPAMYLKGSQAAFVDPDEGVKIRPAGHGNQMADMINAIARSGAPLIEMSEHFVDQALADAYPRAAPYVGWPMVVVFRLGA